MTKKQPAHPIPGYREKPPVEGVSALTWIATHAMAGELAAQSGETGEWKEGSYGVLAERCYDIAEAMIEEEAKR